jgi:acid phosphatase (class A)
MVRRFLPLFAAAGLAVASLVVAQTPAAPAKGYLTADTTPQTQRILPPPPAPGSGRQANDKAVFARTRALMGSGRWALATTDADLSPRAGMFACALGVTLDAANAPGLDAMLHHMAPDARAVVDPPKDSFNRPRPYVGVAGDPPICVPKTQSLAKSPSYPSGHSTVAWAWGLILAEIAPDRSTEILRRAREIGDSRIICGVHYLSDVEEGRTNGSILVAALHANPEFQADLAKARSEVAAARAAAHPAPTACAAIADAEAHPPY